MASFDFKRGRWLRAPECNVDFSPSPYSGESFPSLGIISNYTYLNEYMVTTNRFVSVKVCSVELYYCCNGGVA